MRVLAAPAADLLRSHVVWSADRRGQAEPGEPPCGLVHRNPEIEELDLAARREEHVVGLEVPVHDASPVQVDQSARDLAGDGEGLLGREALALAHDGPEGLALGVFHHKVDAGLFLGREDADDVGVIELLADLLLMHGSAPKNADVALELHVRHLQGDLPAGALVDRLEDRGHAAAGEQLK